MLFLQCHFKYPDNKMRKYRSGTVMISANLLCGYFPCRACGSNKGNQNRCIILSFIIVLFHLKTSQKTCPSTASDRVTLLASFSMIDSNTQKQPTSLLILQQGFRCKRQPGTVFTGGETTAHNSLHSL